MYCTDHPLVSVLIFMLISVSVRGQEDICSDGAYSILNDPNRSILDTVSSGTQCDGRVIDRTLWYRFKGAGGNMIPETCPPTNRCRTHATAFINGTHPTGLEVKAMTACVHWSSNCCYKRLDVKVKLCPSDSGNFYVYQLTYPVPSWCSFRYCTVNDTVPTLEPPAPTEPTDPTAPAPVTLSTPFLNLTCPDCKLTCPRVNVSCPDCKCPDVQLSCPSLDNLCPDCDVSCPAPDVTCPACQTTCPSPPNVSCPACVCPDCRVTCPQAPSCNLTCGNAACPDSQGDPGSPRSGKLLADSTSTGSWSENHSTEVLGLAVALSFILGGVCGALVFRLAGRKFAISGRRITMVPSSSGARVPTALASGGSCNGIDTDQCRLIENQYDELRMLGNPLSECSSTCT